VYTAAMDFTRHTCWFLFLKSLLIKNNKKRETALKSEAGGDEKHNFFTWPKRPLVGYDHPIRLRKQQNLQGNERSLQHATGK